MVQHRAALCQLWRVQMAENAQKVPKFPPAHAPHEGVQGDAHWTVDTAADPAFGATR
jgi:hypothetical protein